MLKLLLGVVVEVFVGVSLAGLILALAIPLLNRNDLPGRQRHVQRRSLLSACSSALSPSRSSGLAARFTAT